MVCSRLLIFAIAKSEYAVSIVVQFFQIATEGVLCTYGIKDRVRIGKALLLDFCSFAFKDTDDMDIKKVIYDHLYELAAVTTS